jgi:hypothetical protein
LRPVQLTEWRRAEQQPLQADAELRQRGCGTIRMYGRGDCHPSG